MADDLTIPKQDPEVSPFGHDHVMVKWKLSAQPDVVWQAAFNREQVRNKQALALVSGDAVSVSCTPAGMQEALDKLQLAVEAANGVARGDRKAALGSVEVVLAGEKAARALVYG